PPGGPRRRRRPVGRRHMSEGRPTGMPPARPDDPLRGATMTASPSRRRFIWGASRAGLALLAPGLLGASAQEGHSVITTTTQPTEPPTPVERRVPRGASAPAARDSPGAAPACVLLHGFPDTRRLYAPLAPRWAGVRRRVAAVASPGYGASDKPDGSPSPAATLGGARQAVVA